MEFSPEALARITLESLLWGSVLGIFSAVSEYLRLLISKDPNRFPNHLSIQKCPLIGSYVKQSSRKTKFFLNITTFFLDFFLCILAAVGILLLSFIGNEGRIRLIFVIMMLFGFLTMRAVGRKRIILILRYICFFLYVMALYIAFFALFPFRCIFRKICKYIAAFVQRMRCHIRIKREQHFSEKEKTRVLALAENGFGCLSAIAKDAGSQNKSLNQ